MDRIINFTKNKLSHFSCGLNSINEEKGLPQGEPVYVNVYDLHWSNEYTQPIGFGIYHSGVQVYNKEYGFGGHPYDSSGIFQIEPKDTAPMGQEFVYNQTIFIGYTYFKPNCIDRFLEDIQDEFAGSRYHLLRHNCNHFSDRLLNFLCNQSLPTWINRTAGLISSVKILEDMIPKEYMRPPTQDEFESSLNQCQNNDCDTSDNDSSALTKSSYSKDVNNTASRSQSIASEDVIVEVKANQNRGAAQTRHQMTIKPNTTFNINSQTPLTTTFSHS